MSEFTTPVILYDQNQTDEAGRPLYRLGQDLVYRWGYQGVTITVPAGRVTNLATVPKIWPLGWVYKELVTRNGKYIAAAVLHDYMCNEQFPGSVQEHAGFTRFQAAAMFRSSLRGLGSPSWLSFTAYWAVRANDARIWLLKTVTRK